MVKVSIPESKARIQKQITALESVLKQDSSEKDKAIHSEALEALKEALMALEGIEKGRSNAGRPPKISTEKVLELRKEGLTQEQIARTLNVSLSSIRRTLKKEDEANNEA